MLTRIDEVGILVVVISSTVSSVFYEGWESFHNRL